MKAATGVIVAVGLLALHGSACGKGDRQAPNAVHKSISPARADQPLPPGKKVVLANGLQMQDLVTGEDGTVASKGKIVAIHYTGWLQDEKTVIDSTRDRQPLQFQLGEGTVLQGWDVGVEGMKVGGKRKLTVPPALAFGKRALGAIKPDSTLVFEVELVKVQSSTQ